MGSNRKGIDDEERDEERESTTRRSIMKDRKRQDKETGGRDE